MNSKFEALDSHAECRRTSATTRSTTRLCSRECTRLHDEHLARTQQDCCTISRNQQVRQRKEKHFDGIREFGLCGLTQKQCGCPTKSRRNLPKVLPSSSTWDQTHWKDEQLEFSAFFKVSRFVNFSHSSDRFLLPRENLQPTGGGCEQYTHKYSMYRVAQHDHISSREHAWLKSCKAQECTSLYPYNSFNPRVMSHSLPHLTLTTSISSLSPISSTSPIFPTVSPNKPYDSHPINTLRWSTAEWRINTGVSRNSSRPKRSSL